MDGTDKEEKKRLKKELEEKKRLEKWIMAWRFPCRYEHIKQKTKARTREHMYRWLGGCDGKKEEATRVRADEGRRVRRNDGGGEARMDEEDA